MPKRPALLLVLTLAAIVTGMAVGVLSPKKLAHPKEGPTVLALELVRTAEEFNKIAQQPTLEPSGYWASTLFWRGTIADFVFIAAYGALWIALPLYAGVPRRRWLSWVASACVLVAAIADIIENCYIAAALEDASYATVIRPSALVKWGLLGVAFLILFRLLWPREPMPKLSRYLLDIIALAYGAAGAACLIGVLGRESLLAYVSLALGIALLAQAALLWGEVAFGAEAVSAQPGGRA